MPHLAFFPIVRRIVLALAGLTLTATLFASTPAAAQRGKAVTLSGPAQRLGDWSIRMVKVEYGDMSRPTELSAVRVTFMIKNVGSAPQSPRFGASLYGLRQYTPDVIDDGFTKVVEPGKEFRFYVQRRFSGIQHRWLKSITLIDGNSRDENGPAKLETAIAPLDPGWVDPDLVKVDNPWTRLKYWSARVVSMHHGDLSGPNAPWSEFIIAFALKNVSGDPLDPSNFEWMVKGANGNHSLGSFKFSVREGELVPPGGEIIVYANNGNLTYQEHMELQSLVLTEHAPGEPISPRNVMAKVELRLPRPPFK